MLFTFYFALVVLFIFLEFVYGIRPLWASIFYEGLPGLRLLCAPQLTAGAAELAALRQSSRYSALSFQCSTTQKGQEDQNQAKTGSM